LLICKIRAKIIKITLKAVACGAKKLDIAIFVVNFTHLSFSKN
jgi:hypothetical protein